ncbi:hypothetical protein DSECCO2_645520 [anaerobic digester metagenome]
MGSALNTDNRIVSNEFFCVSKLSRKLIIQIGTIGNHHNGRTFEIFAFHQQPCKIQHGETLTAPGSAKISSAFSIAFRSMRFADIFKQRLCCVILRITANNLFFLFARIRHVNKIPDDVAQTILMKHSLNQSVHAIYTVHFFC